MGKHVYTSVVLVCTLSTRSEGNDRTLPGQDAKERLEKKIPGIR